MATIANLVVEISAKSSKLKKSLAGSKSAVAKFAKDSIKSLAKIGAAVGAAFAASAALALVAMNKIAASIDRVAKRASELGILVSELQKLQLAAELSGVSADKLGVGLEKMARQVSDAAQGTGEAVDALKQLGLSAKDLNSLSIDDQFKKIADAFGTIGNKSDQVRIAMEIFGRAGGALVNTLTSDLAGVAREFDALGLGITQSQAKAVEAFNDSKTVLGAVFTGVGQKITASLSPVFTNLINNVKEFIKAAGGINTISKKISVVLVEAVQKGINIFTRLVKVVTGSQLIFKQVVSVVKAIGSAISSVLSPAFRGLVGFIDRVIAGFSIIKNEFSTVFESMSAGVGSLVGELKELIDAFGVVRDTMSGEFGGDLTSTVRKVGSGDAPAQGASVQGLLQSITSSLDPLAAATDASKLALDNFTESVVKSTKTTGDKSPSSIFAKLAESAKTRLKTLESGSNLNVTGQKQIESLKRQIDLFERSVKTSEILSSARAKGDALSAQRSVSLQESRVATSSNTPPPVTINVEAKTQELFKFIVESPQFSSKVNGHIEERTEDARRRITR